MTTKIDQVKEMKMYYQEFHHKCITWYITIMVFFIAGAIAYNGEGLVLSVGITVIFFTGLFTFTIFGCIFHYSARIDVLNTYLSTCKDEIPDDWYTRSKNVSISIKGFGSFFFALIGIITFMCVSILSWLKFIS
ncbi:hypothetical protein LP316_11175 [Thalassotalea sp. LPB0316]|uniref:hypothetical protein n=1 Tax=Thalassotalea sp. LPB0316 TaxID=2769490 RepID=UPI0018694ED6|nr:hypothetical protein [Thalassotalea sp. LPB0316]QOL24869.1 hypothetical protein LP316_11175 [Thalassotalea sp. LPB0316]